MPLTETDKATLLRIAMDAQRQQRERAARTGGRFVQTFDPIQAQRSASEIPRVYLPQIERALAKKLASMTEQSGGGGDGSGSSGNKLSTKFQQYVDKGMTTEEAARQVEKEENARIQSETAKKPAKKNVMGIPWTGKAWDIAKKVPGGLAAGTWKQFQTGMDILSRPGLAMTTAMYDRAKDVNDLFTGEFKTKELWDVAKKQIPVAGLAMDTPAMKRGLLKEKGKTHGGHDVLDVLGWETSGKKNIANKIAHAVAGFGVELAADPTTYIGGVGTTSLAENAGKTLAKEGVEGVAKKTALEELENIVRRVGKGPASKTKRIVKGEAEAISTKLRNQAYNTLEPYVNMADDAILPRITDRTYRRILKEVETAVKEGDVPEYALSRAVDKMGKNATKAMMATAGKGALQYKLGGILGFGGTDILKGGKLAEQLYRPLGVLPRMALPKGTAKVGGKALAEGLEEAVTETGEQVAKEAVPDIAGEAIKKSPLAEEVIKSNPLRNVKGKIVDSDMPTKARQWFNFEAHFPGLTTRMRAKVRAMGYQGFMSERRQLLKDIRGTTPAQRKQMFDMIEAGQKYTEPEDAHLQVLMDKIKDYFKKTKNLDEEIGHKSWKEMMTENYVYHGFKKARKHKAEIAQWKDYRRKQLGKNFTNKTPLELNVSAKNLAELHPNLRPYLIDDVGEAVLQRIAKGNRDAMRAWYRTEVLNTYGELIPDSSPVGHKKELVKVDPRHVTPQLKELMDEADGHYYLPKDIAETFKKFDDLQAIGNEDVAGIWRGLDKFNRGFKFGATVPNPGYHVRNMLSDAMLSFFDNTDPRDYARVAMGRLRKGGTGSFTTDGIETGYRELFDGYRKHGGAGTFYRTDLGERGGSAFNKGMQTPSRITDRLRTMSEGREDFGRIAHFKSAYEQELKAELKRVRGTAAGQKKLATVEGLNKAKEQAMLAAMDRVNKFNFDYTALTPFEQNIAKRAIPFYTFTRKATPLMIEQLATNPGKMMLLDKMTRGLQDLLGVDADLNLPFEGFGTPPFMQEPGFTRLNNEAEPSFGTFGDFMPQAIVPNVFGAGADENEMLTQFMSRLNPALRALPEIQRGKSYFGSRKIEGPLDWAVQEFNPLRTWTTKMTGDKRETSGTDWKDTAAAIAGIPFYRATEERQIGASKFQEERHKKELEAPNQALRDRGYEWDTTTKKGKKIYRIIDRIKGKVIYESDDPVEVREYANTLYP